MVAGLGLASWFLSWPFLGLSWFCSCFFVLAVIPSEARNLSSISAFGKIAPFGILRLDQRDLLRAGRTLYFLIPRNGWNHAAVRLEPDQAIRVVPGREAGHSPLFVLPDARGEVARHSAVKHAGLAGQDVNARRTFHGARLCHGLATCATHFQWLPAHKKAKRDSSLRSE